MKSIQQHTHTHFTTKAQQLNQPEQQSLLRAPLINHEKLQHY